MRLVASVPNRPGKIINILRKTKSIIYHVMELINIIVDHLISREENGRNFIKGTSTIEPGEK